MCEVSRLARRSRLGIRDLLKLAPTGLVGCFLTGFARSVFRTFAPLYARTVIGSGAPVNLFMAACVLAGAVFQRPVGRLSDRTDRRCFILQACVASSGLGLSLALGRTLGTAETYGVGFLFGAATLSIYSLRVVYANACADPDAYVDVSGILLLVTHGTQALVGLNPDIEANGPAIGPPERSADQSVLTGASVASGGVADCSTGGAPSPSG